MRVWRAPGSHAGVAAGAPPPSRTAVGDRHRVCSAMRRAAAAPPRPAHAPAPAATPPRRGSRVDAVESQWCPPRCCTARRCVGCVFPVTLFVPLFIILSGQLCPTLPAGFRCATGCVHSVLARGYTPRVTGSGPPINQGQGIKTDEFCNENDEFCNENDEFCNI